MSFLINTSSSKAQLAGRLSAEEGNVISEGRKLLEAVQQSPEETRLKAVQDLDKLCERPENMEILCLNEDLSLLFSLKQLLETIKNDDNSLYWVVVCINSLSSGDISCKVAITSKELALLPVLMKILRSSSDEKMIEMIEMAVSNCSMFEGCHDYLLSSEILWLDYLEKRLKEKPNDMYSYWWFVNFISNIRNENVLLLINRKIPEVLLQKLLSYGLDMKKWSADDGKVVRQIIAFVMYFSKSMNGSRYLMVLFNLHSQLNTFFFDLLPSASMISVRAMIIVANVYGREENNERTKALLSSHPSILPLLIDIMDAIINSDVNRTEIKELMKKGFRYGFQLSVVAVALRNLSISDENKSIMIKYPKLIRLACQGIRLFIDNAPECRGVNPGQTWYCEGGGGGKDMLTVENLLELLLQLSFMFEDDIALKSAFITPGHDLQKMLEELLNIPIERQVSSETGQFALKLLSKLDPPKVPETDSGICVGCQHIMLSYSWSANKDLVIEFGKKLQEMGYDVWRDEEGSSIMGPISMAGTTLDAMTEAVEKSYMMIIFVSPEYKESTNCRTEGLYGFKRAANSGLKLLYVMMNENYTTESQPVAVNGWLAGMIGAEVWYPLWNTTQLTSTVNAIVLKLGNYGRLTSNIPLTLQSPSSLKSPGSSLSAASTKSTSSIGEVVRGLSLLKVEKEADFTSAFQCLQKDKSLCPASFDSLLVSLDIMNSEDLKFADIQIIVTLSCLLRPRFRESFLISLNL
jgi:hypothetical protein